MPDPREFLHSADAAKRSRELIAQLPDIANQMCRVCDMPDTYPLKGTPTGDEWWRQRDAAQRTSLGKLVGPYRDKVAEIESLVDVLLDAAEWPEVRGAGLDLAPPLRTAIGILRGFGPPCPPFVFFNLDPVADQLDKLERRLRIAANSAAPLGSQPNRKSKHQRKRERDPQPLTPKQLQASQLYGEYKGNVSKAAAAMKVSRQTFQEHYEAACKKLGKLSMPKARTQAYRHDQRGQADLVNDRRKIVGY